MAEPARWHEWSPHVRGAWGLGDGEVEGSALGAIRLFGVLPVPARIDLVEKSAERRHWVWKVGLVLIDHEVHTDDDGCTLSLTCHAPWPLEAVIRVTYWPIARRLLERLATVAERELPRPVYA